VIGLAGPYVAFPFWEPTIEQTPPETIVMVDPAIVQIEVVVEASVTLSPELEDALTVKGATPNKTLLIGANVIVCP
jgi:hypothetical protein